MDHCSSSPCQNGGTCTLEAQYFKCMCTQNWAGQFCDMRRADCKTTANLEGMLQKMYHLNNSYLFKIHHILLKTFLFIINLLLISSSIPYIEILTFPGIPLSELCENGGTCKDDGQRGHRCQCTSGYEGSYCRDVIDPCLDPMACKNGATCRNIARKGEFECVCLPGYQVANSIW